MRRGGRHATTTGGAPDIRTLLRVLPDLWPRDHPNLRVRVVIALAFLILAKVAVLITPFLYRAAVDGLAPADGALIIVPFHWRR